MPGDETLHEELNRAVESAIARDVDVDAIEAELDSATERLEHIRAFRGEGVTA